MKFLRSRKIAQLEDRELDLKARIAQLEREESELRDQLDMERRAAEEALRKQKHKAEDDLANERRKLEHLKARAKREDEELAHIVKLAEHKLQQEYDRKTLALEKLKQDEIANTRDLYRDKLEKHLEGRNDQMQAMYAEVLARLPNMNVKLRGDISNG